MSSEDGLRTQEILRRYLVGELDLESAAQGIHKGGEYGMYYTTDTTTPEDQERLDALFGYILWLSLRESSPDGAPNEPFGAAEFRAMAKGEYFDEPDEAPNPFSDSDPDGTA